MRYLLIMLLCIPNLSLAGGSHNHNMDIDIRGDTTQTVNNVYVNKRSNEWKVPVAIIVIGAGVCWMWCKKLREPAPLPKSTSRNDITPDNASDPPVGFILKRAN